MLCVGRKYLDIFAWKMRGVEGPRGAGQAGWVSFSVGQDNEFFNLSNSSHHNIYSTSEYKHIVSQPNYRLTLSSPASAPVHPGNTSCFLPCLVNHPRLSATSNTSKRRAPTPVSFLIAAITAAPCRREHDPAHKSSHLCRARISM